jgi:glutaredoxin 3
MRLLMILSIFALSAIAAPTSMPQKAKVEVYSAENCTWCTSAKNLLNEMGVKYTEYDVVKDPSKYRDLKKKGHTTVPQIYVNGEHIGSYMSLAMMSEDTLKAKLKDAALKADEADAASQVKPASTPGK